MEFLLLDHPWRFWLAAASFTLLGASYLVTSVVRMRVLAIGAFTLGALSLALDSEHPLWLEVVGLLGLAAINGLQWVRQKKKGLCRPTVRAGTCPACVAVPEPGRQ